MLKQCLVSKARGHCMHVFLVVWFSSLSIGRLFEGYLGYKDMAVVGLFVCLSWLFAMLLRFSYPRANGAKRR